ncbi:hypothetical protein [Glycomyces tritici]|uniref:DUF4190 domain-containing protein n=1 Tax=Glycomyces tritici TaxID=2665176 RepID=A0ABT7YNG6_9ACTN|nr:hypothetical protein [Glycomyces tritici]MDN3239027.1 hypothetical protein [Glycomyces tritici]MDN3240189.1 hypothetical protein [Glycomyces tritici]
MQQPPQAPPVPPVHGYPQPQPQPQYQHLYPMQPMQPVWQPMAVPAPVLVDGFPLMFPRLKPIPSGPAIGSLVAGIAGIGGAVPGLIGAIFSPWAGLTFFMSAALFGIGSVSLAVYAKRQIRYAQGGVSGKGIATTGLILGLVACGLALLVGLISLVNA